MSEHNIVVLGASWAGLSIAHYLLKHVVPTLPKDHGSYKVVVISPNSDLYHRVGGPRIITAKDALPEEKYLLPIADKFKQYPAQSYSLIEGKATAVDTDARTVTYQLNRSTAGDTIPYHALVIATGFSTPLKAWSNEDDVSVLKAEIADLQKRLPNAKSIVIAGGGPAGVETAGEIGELINGRLGWFASRPKDLKTRITLIQGESKLLPILRPALAKKAEGYLYKMGVDVVYNTKVVSEDVAADGTATLRLSNGETIACDVYIPATGARPNTSFLPKELLDSRGRVQTNASTLRVDGAGPRVYAVGDVGSHTRGGIMAIYEAVPVVATNLQRDLKAFNGSEKAESRPAGPDRTYKDNTTETQFVPVGRRQGVASAFGWKLPSFMVWLVKGRDYMAWGLPPIVDGSKWKAESKWKGA